MSWQLWPGFLWAWDSPLCPGALWLHLCGRPGLKVPFSFALLCNPGAGALKHWASPLRPGAPWLLPGQRPERRAISCLPPACALGCVMGSRVLAECCVAAAAE